MSREPSSTPSRVYHKSGTVGTTKAQLSSSPSLVRGLTIKAASGNANTIYVGGPTVTQGTGNEDGYPLAAGDSLFLAVQNADQIWLVGGAASQDYSVVGL